MRFTFGTAIIGSLVLAAPADGQQASTPRRALPRIATAADAPAAAHPPAPRHAPSSASVPRRDRIPRIAYAADPPPPQAAPVYVVPQVYFIENGYVLSAWPYLVLSDGTMLVSFGNGYERVLRSCAVFQSAAPADPWARDALGRIPEPPGIAALRVGTRGQAFGGAPASNATACYRNDAQGRLEVVTLRY